MDQNSSLPARDEDGLDRIFARVNPRLLDRFEQALLAILWGWLFSRVVASPNDFAPLIMISETALLLFVLIRRPTRNISLRLGDWLLAIAATAAPLLIQPVEALWPTLVPLGVILVMFGNLVQFFAKLSLRRSFGMAPANRGIKSDGLYRFVRHPMYAGYLGVHIGILILMPSAINLLVYALGWWAQILRLRAEETLLCQDETYRAYTQKVRYRLIPGLF